MKVVRIMDLDHGEPFGDLCIVDLCPVCVGSTHFYLVMVRDELVLWIATQMSRSCPKSDMSCNLKHEKTISRGTETSLAPKVPHWHRGLRKCDRYWSHEPGHADVIILPFRGSGDLLAEVRNTPGKTHNFRFPCGLQGRDSNYE